MSWQLYLYCVLWFSLLVSISLILIFPVTILCVCVSSCPTCVWTFCFSMPISESIQLFSSWLHSTLKGGHVLSHLSLWLDLFISVKISSHFCLLFGNPTLPKLLSLFLGRKFPIQAMETFSFYWIMINFEWKRGMGVLVNLSEINLCITS